MDRRKELKDSYKDRTVIGGVFCIMCTASGRTWMKATTDLRGQQSRFRFAVMNNSYPEPGMREDWMKYGTESFTFTVLEELEKEKTQSDIEFAADTQALLELWIEKQGQSKG